ncbi:MAG TPA: hypothetical protein VGJ93_12620 [Desulfuromonadaceae bacterium]
MSLPDQDNPELLKQCSDSLISLCGLARKTLLRSHSSDYLDKNPALLAACIQACAIERATIEISRQLTRLEKAILSRSK